MRKRAEKAGLALVLLAGALLVGGCSRPSEANIELRKQVQTLQTQLSESQAARAQAAEMIRGLQSRIPTEPTLPAEQLAKLFTTHGLGFNRLTGGADLDPNKPGDEGISVYVYPIDQEGQPIKAAGSFVVEAFDLASPNDPRIGRWAFPLEEAKKTWAGYWVLQSSYVLTCPWQKVPQHADLMIRVTFVDELTKVPFWAQRAIHVELAHPATAPATTEAATLPATRPAP